MPGLPSRKRQKLSQPQRYATGHSPALIYMSHSLVQSSKADRFASGSLDGSILVWHAGQEILPVFRLNFPEQYINQDHIYMYSVNCLLKVGEVRYRTPFYATRTARCLPFRLQCSHILPHV
jgi:hypothetical protein